MILKVGSWAQWINSDVSGCLESGFFQGIDGANRLVFCGVNGMIAVDAGKTLKGQNGNLYTLVEYNGPKLSLIQK